MDEGKAIGYALAIVGVLSGVVVFLFKVFYTTITDQAKRTQEELETEKNKREKSDEKLHTMQGKMEATMEARNMIAEVPNQVEAVRQMHADAIAKHKQATEDILDRLPQKLSLEKE